MKKVAFIILVVLTLFLISFLFDSSGNSIPNEITADYINDLNRGGRDNYIKVLHSDKIEQGYICLVETKEEYLDVVYLEYNPKKDKLQFKSRASINPLILNDDPTFYDTITPIASKYDDFIICYSLSKEPNVETISVCGNDVSVHKIKMDINGDETMIGFWCVVVDSSKNIIVS